MTLTDYMCKEKREEEDLSSIEDSVDASIQLFEENCGGTLITATRNDNNNTMTSWTELTRKQKLEEKQLFGLTTNNQHLTRTNVYVAKKRKHWERNWISSNSTSNNTIKTNHINARIDKTQQSSKCCWCGDWDETINRILSKSSKERA